jgi:hypothetical protein
MLFSGDKEKLMEAVKASRDYTDGDLILWEIQDFEQRTISTLAHMYDAEVAKEYAKSLTKILERIITEIE